MICGKKWGGGKAALLCVLQRSLLSGPSLLPSLANEKCLISWKEIAQPKLQRRGPVINEPSFRKEVPLRVNWSATPHAFCLWVAYFQQFYAHTLGAHLSNLTRCRVKFVTKQPDNQNYEVRLWRTKIAHEKASLLQS